jgi:hypothetical protein
VIHSEDKNFAQTGTRTGADNPPDVAAMRARKVARDGPLPPSSCLGRQQAAGMA